MNTTPHISVVIPVYGYAQCLNELCQRLIQSLAKINQNFEIILVNDASPDDSWSIIKDLASKDKRVKGINLSKNFGQHKAITAGIEHVTGEWIIVMDCDLQDQPEEIHKLYAQTHTNYDIIVASRNHRKHSFYHILCANIFYKITTCLTKTKYDPNVSSFGIYSKKVIDVFKQHQEKHRSFGMIINLLGFRRTSVLVEHNHSTTNKSSYNFSARFDLALSTIIAHSNKPLRFSIVLGFLISLYTLAYSTWLVIRYFLYGLAIDGWTSIMVSLYAISGMLFLMLGILGLYVGKIFNEVKNRPLYIIMDTTFTKQDNDT